MGWPSGEKGDIVSINGYLPRNLYLMSFLDTKTL